MDISHYIDLEIIPMEGVVIPDVMSLALRHLHVSGVPFALAFPDMEGKLFGKRLRVFGSEVDLDAVYDRLTTSQVDDYAKIRRVRAVSDAVKEIAEIKYESFFMLRPKTIGKLKKDLKLLHRKGKRSYSEFPSDILDDILPKLDKKNAHLARTPYLNVRSNTSGAEFKLYIERRPHEGDIDLEAAPNGYGLSRQSHVIALPVIG